MAAVRDTQITVEVLETEANPNTRATQVAVEVLETYANPNTRVTQVAIEVLEKVPSDIINPGLMIIA